MDDPGLKRRKKGWMRYVVFLIMLPGFPFVLIAGGAAAFLSFDPAPIVILSVALIGFAILVGVAEGKRRKMQEEMERRGDQGERREMHLDDILPERVNR